MKRKLGLIAVMTLSTVIGSQLALADTTQSSANGTSVVALGQAGENYSPVAFLPAPSQALIKRTAIEAVAIPGENYSPVAFLPALIQARKVERTPALSIQAKDSGTSPLSIGI